MNGNIYVEEKIDGQQRGKNNTVPNGSKETTGRRHKSARPGRISYVPINDEDLAPYEPPVRKKHKGLKITGIAVAMVIVSTGAAYAGMSYYYSDKFFEGTSINGIDCSGKTAYEAEQKIAKTVENYSIEVDSRNLIRRRSAEIRSAIVMFLMEVF